MDKKIYKHFSKTVEDYDTTVDKVVMKNEELQAQIINSLNIDGKKKLKILDIGCGTGHSMLLTLKKFPNSKVVGIDFSRIMIKKARKNLSGFLDRIELIEGDFIENELGKNYDLIISGVTIHNVTHREKVILFEKIFNALNEGGKFVNGDFIGGETIELNEQYRKIYERYLRNNLEGDELKVWLNHAFKEDKPMKITDQFEILKNIGFKEVELQWQFSIEAVYVAKK